MEFIFLAPQIASEPAAVTTQDGILITLTTNNNVNHFALLKRSFGEKIIGEKGKTSLSVRLLFEW